MKHPYQRFLGLVVALLAPCALLAACGDDDASGTASGATTTTTGESEAGSGSFPVTIEHKYGETVVPEAPERVVSVGFTDQDFLLALGVVPVGIRDWYGDQPDATWPWAQDELGAADPEVLGASSIEYEKIAALRPDLIVGVSSGMTDEEYEQLSQIAPTVTQSGEFVDYGTPWQEMTRLIGRAVGRDAEAEAVVEEVERLFAEARDDHPEFAGATANVGALGPDTIYAYGPEDTRGRFLGSLGMQIPQGILDLAGDQFYAIVSAERLDLLDTDLLVWVADSAATLEMIKANPVYQGLAVVEEDRVVYLDDPLLSGAMSFSSPLSLPFAIEQIVPRLAAALDGDPSTPAN